MSLSGILTAARTQTNPTDTYDHAINLVDKTRPIAEPNQDSNESPTDFEFPSRNSSGAPLSRRWTKGTLREEITRRKYAKWQESKFNNREETVELGDDHGNSVDKDSNAAKRDDSKQAVVRSGRLRDRITFSRPKKKAAKAKLKDEYAVDILYENQRGWFLCGIPLYSSKSLLNFDPSPWQTATFKDSPINITNAQLPDPSWVWAWRSWYVDMSHDVDEEGWQYSFSFRQGFSWHGTHPWFHSYVRRRRWLRKRVKAHSERLHGETGDVHEAHMLNADYFTIHAQARGSRESSAERTVNNRSSFRDGPDGKNDDESEVDPEEITNVLALMTALRKARVDREKIEALYNFLDLGGDELFYLADRMEEIMGVFIYQTSRQQLLAHLFQLSKDSAYNADGKAEQQTPETEQARRKADNLLKAVSAAEVHIKNLEYWSDVRVLAKSGDIEETTDDNQVNPSSWQGLDPRGPAEVSDIEPKATEYDETRKFDEEIKGIPDDAETFEEPRISRGTPQSLAETKSPAKGKGKA
ncbi:hypothetical protein MMC12_003999 [Toensbergia leucococca]|nr:hypothetical protein [Toensbergia leucococca]